MRYLIALILCLLIATPSFSAITWTDYGSNPLSISGVGSRAYMPTVLYNVSWGASSAYKMWYDYASNAGVGLTVSADGITWSSATGNSGIQGTSGRPNVIYNASWTNPYRIYYSTGGSATDNIRTAESNDGITWINDTVAFSTGVTFPDGHCVLYDTSLTPNYQMFYWGTSGGTRRATSTNGITFTDAGVAFATAEQPTCVLKIKAGDYRLWSFPANTQINYYTSSDGTTYTQAQAPVSTVGGVGTAGTWNASRNYHCSVVYLGSGNFKMWRSGYSGTVYTIGYATGVDPTAVSDWSIY